MSKQAVRAKSAPRRASGDSGRVVQLPEPSPLASLPAEIRGRLFPLLKDGPHVVEQLTGKRPHRLTVLRWAVAGASGIRLRTVSVGRARFTTREWLLLFWQQLDEARRAD